MSSWVPAMMSELLPLAHGGATALAVDGATLFLVWFIFCMLWFLIDQRPPRR